MAAEKSAGKQRGKPFPKGTSGSPAGKPKGARSRSTILAEKLMETDAEDVVRAVITAAKAGDMTAARLVLDRIAPARKGRAVRFTLPPVETPSDVVTALGAVVRAVAAGELTTDEAAAVAALLEAKRKALETVEMERRLAALETVTAAKRRAL